MLIVVVAPCLYRSKACLEEIHYGLQNPDIEMVLPVLFEGQSTRVHSIVFDPTNHA